MYASMNKPMKALIINIIIANLRYFKLLFLSLYNFSRIILFFLMYDVIIMVTPSIHRKSTVFPSEEPSRSGQSS